MAQTPTQSNQLLQSVTKESAHADPAPTTLIQECLDKFATNRKSLPVHASQNLHLLVLLVFDDVLRHLFHRLVDVENPLQVQELVVQGLF